MSKQYKPKQNIKDIPPYCKVCHDAGKSDYNKHGLKDKNGKTICPYLLSLQCNNCKAFGHTQKHCDKNKQSAKTVEDKFCGFCYKVNKNDPAYKTHYVRKNKDDANSEITCPRLKTTECNYCHELGHTPVNCENKKRNSAKKISYEDELKSYDIEKLEELLKDEYECIDKYEIEMLGGLKTKEIDEAFKHKTIAENRFKLIKEVIKEKMDEIADERDDETTKVVETTPKKPNWASRFDSKPKICNAPIPLTRTLTLFGIETKPLPLQSAVVNQTQPQPLTETETVKTPKKIISWADDSDDE
jgi:hypothetical protein